MEPPALKLVMVQGPRKGETLEFRTGSTIRIGRVVRGNNVTIKDAGISSKHLLIDCKSGKWIVQDLDSSNGTTLNSSRLPPCTPFDLRDCDTIKLGEFTSILVQFSSGEEPSQLRRNPRRKGNELDKVGSVTKALVKTEPMSESKLENAEKLQESAAIDEKPRRGRPRKGRVLDKVIEIDNESENVDTVAEILGITGSRKKDNCLNSVKESENVGNVDEKPRVESINVRHTRSRKMENCLISENLGGECGKTKRGGRGRRKNLQELPPENADVGLGLNLREDTQEQANEVDVSRDEEVKCGTMRYEEKKEGLGTETNCKAADIGPVLKESDVEARVNDGENLGAGEEIVDFQKMTVVQWFDYMEVHLPKHITEATEEILQEMIRKAQRVREYMIEQKKAKALPILN